MLALPQDVREALWQRVAGDVEHYLRHVGQLPVSPPMDPARLREDLRQYDFRTPLSPNEAVRVAVEGLTRSQVHTPHPSYFGLFNPAPTTMGIAADTLAAAFNPQMAAWSHNPFACEVEMHLVRAVAEKFGYSANETDGTFCSGGMEANHTGLLTALTWHFPEFREHGLRALPSDPVMYVSAESHHSFRKAALMTGLGLHAVRLIDTDARFCLRPESLESAIAEDKRAGNRPFLVGATVGTTSSGATDPLHAVADICKRHDLWLHTDAAWGGAAALLPELRTLLTGIERSDSITFDAHKWFSVPMGAGLFLTRHPAILDRTFRVMTAYMPKDADSLDVKDPHLRSMQWSRRFIGLKVFLSLLVAGWDGYSDAIRHQTAMGRRLRDGLRENGWEIVNDTPLPLVCFAERGADAAAQRTIAERVVQSGEAWISPTVVNGRTVIRACITNFNTSENDVDRLIASVEAARIPQAG